MVYGLAGVSCFVKMSKFRARQLDASKPIPIYLQDDIADYTDFHNATNRTVPQMPTGMEKEEESEHHLQEAIFKQKIIPVPEVFDTTSTSNGLILFDKMYPPSYKVPRQMIHIHPFSAEQDRPDYDLDSEDEVWISQHEAKGELPLDFLQFEEMMDRLEKASGLKAVTLQEAKLLLKDDDDLITAVYDYWLNKRLRLQHPLIPHVRKVKSEKGTGTGSSDPYVAFRKRTEKMQTRKNRKNDESSFERMLKLKRDVVRAVTLLEMVKKREKSKRELLNLNIEVFEKRYEIGDYSGTVLAEVSALRTQRPAFAPLISNHQLPSGTGASGAASPSSNSSSWLKVPSVSHPNKVSKKRVREDGKRERRPYKKWRRHHHLSSSSSTPPPTAPQLPPSYSHPPDPYAIASTYPQGRLTVSSTNLSDDEAASASQSEPDEDSIQGIFTFKRKKYVNYHAPKEGNWPWVAPSEGGGGDPKYSFSLTSLGQPSSRKCIGFARRRVGRGGRVWIDRASTPLDDLWSKNDFRDTGPNGLTIPTELLNEIKTEWPHYCPSSPVGDPDSDAEDIDVETVTGLSRSSAPASPPLLPSSVMIHSEVMEGDCRGATNQLEVCLPMEGGRSSTFTASKSLGLGENLHFPLRQESSSPSGKGGKVPPKSTGSMDRIISKGSVLGGLTDNLRGKMAAAVNDMAESEWPSGKSSNLFRTNNIKNSISGSSINSRNNSTSSLSSSSFRGDFFTQPSSKFLIIESNPSSSGTPQRCSVPQVGDEVYSKESSESLRPSLLQQPLVSISTAQVGSFVSSSMLSSSSSSTVLSPSPSLSSTQSLSLSSSITSTSLISNNVGDSSTSNKRFLDYRGSSLTQSDTSNKLTNTSTSASFMSTNSTSTTPASSVFIHSQKDSHGDSNSNSLPNLVVSTTKNNGSNLIVGGVTPTTLTSNHLNTHKLFSNSRTSSNNDSMVKSSTNNSLTSAILSNGPNSSLQNSKCTTKKDHYVFHES